MKFLLGLVILAGVTAMFIGLVMIWLWVLKVLWHLLIILVNRESGDEKSNSNNNN